MSEDQKEPTLPTDADVAAGPNVRVLPRTKTRPSNLDTFVSYFFIGLILSALVYSFTYIVSAGWHDAIV